MIDLSIIDISAYQCITIGERGKGGNAYILYIRFCFMCAVRLRIKLGRSGND